MLCSIEFLIQALVFVSSLLFVLSITLILLICKKHRVNRFLNSKVKERTRQLELGRYELRRMHAHHANFFCKAFQDIKAPLATLNGVYNAAFFEVKDELALHYMRKTQLTTDLLIDLVNRLALVNKLNQHELKRKQTKVSEMTDVSKRKN